MDTSRLRQRRVRHGSEAFPSSRIHELEEDAVEAPDAPDASDASAKPFTAPDSDGSAAAQPAVPSEPVLSPSSHGSVAAPARRRPRVRTLLKRMVLGPAKLQGEPLRWKPVLAAACCGLSLLFVSVAVALVGLWAHPSGRALLHKEGLILRADLLTTPPSRRGLSWRLRSAVAAAAFDFPGFIVGWKGERANAFAFSAELSGGEPVAFRSGFQTFSHAAAVGVMADPVQPRGPYLGASKVPAQCMGPDTLIFLPSGPGTPHAALRGLLLDAVPAFQGTDPRGAALPLEWGADAGLFGNLTARTGEPGVEEERAALLKRTLIRTLFRTLFNASLSAEGLDAFQSYATLGGTCVFGEGFHSATGGFILSKVEALRLRIRAEVAASPVGQAVKAAAAAAAAAGTLPAATEEERSGDAVVRQLSDGAAFAGMLGTTHLTTRALARLRSDPAHLVPLFLADPVAFLHEEARVDPPVTSVTAVLPAPREVSLGPHSTAVAFEAGQPFQVSISTANTDPRVFGGARRSRTRALEFDPARDDAGNSLSWNGRLVDVQAFTAPRGCPGYRLSVALARSLLLTFAPGADAHPVPLDPDSVAARSTLAAGTRDPLANAAAGPFAPSAAAQAPSGPSSLDRAGFAVWMLLCLGATGWLLGRGVGPSSIRYCIYLLAQAAVAATYLTGAEWVFVVAQMVAAGAYMTLFLQASCQRSPATGIALSVVVWATWAALVCVVTGVHARVGSVPQLQVVSTLFYGVGAALAVAMIIRFHREAKAASAQADAELAAAVAAKPAAPAATVAAAAERAASAAGAEAASRWGLLGAFFGIFDLLLIGVPVFGHLLSRVADSLLYVPPILPAVLAMDKAYPASVTLPRFRTLRLCAIAVPTACALLALGGAAGWAYVSSGNLCGYEPASTGFEPLPGTPDATLCTSTPLTRVDAYGRAMYAIVKSYVGAQEAHKEAVENPLAVRLPAYERGLPRVEVIAGSGWTIPTEDEDIEGETSWLRDTLESLLLDHLLRSPVFFPIHDDPTPWKNVQEARAALRLAGGSLLPAPVSDWAGVDFTADETISRMAFTGFAGLRLRALPAAARATDPDNATFFVDYSELVGLEVRPGFERFGATAFFARNRTLVRVRWSAAGADVRPGDTAWEHAKFVFRCSALVGVTATEHLMLDHLMVSNLASTASREMLPPDHPLRRFLKPYTHRTPSVNMGAYRFLTVENALLHRAFSLSFKGLRDAFLLGLKVSRIGRHPLAALEAVMAETDLTREEFPVGGDGLAFWRVVRAHVQRYIATYYATDAAVQADADLASMWRAMRVNGEDSGLPPFPAVTRADLVDLAASYIFSVTGLHHTVGNVAEYLMDPQFAAPRIRPGRNIADIEASHYGLLIAVLTGVRAPMLMADFSHLLLQDAHLNATTAVLAQFQVELAQLSEDITARNAQRAWAFHGFQPNRMVSSVSI